MAQVELVLIDWEKRRNEGSELPGTGIMAHLADKAHFDKHTLARVNSAIMLGLIGGGLLLCVLGAAVYDLDRLLSGL